MILENFIVFEGIDGSGTSTQLQKLVQKMPQLLLPTCEPTTNETGKFLRQVLNGNIKLDEKTNAFLFAADRCEHLYGKNGVIESINNGKIVVSDRYFFSSLAYQSASLGDELPKLLNSTFPLPQLLFFFEIDPNISIQRVNSRNEKKEIYEKLETQIKIASLYLKIINDYESNNNEMKIIKVDASKSIEEIEAFIWNSVKNFYNL